METTQTGAGLSLIESLTKHWWVLLIRGLLVVLLGIFAVVSPGMTLAAFCYVLGAFLAADGILAIVAGVAGWVQSRAWTMVRGALMLIVGFAIMAWPALIGAVAALTLVYFIAVGLFVGGVLEVIAAVRNRKAIKGEGWIILHGAMMAIFGLVLALMPTVSAAALIMVAGVYAIIFGVLMCVASFRLKGLRAA